MKVKSIKWKVVMLACVSMAFQFPFSTFHLLLAQDSLVSVHLPGGATMEMVWVEGGVFRMGSNDGISVKERYDATSPEHMVRVDGYYIGRYEVTQGQWSAVMGENPSHFRGSDSLPVEQVSWVEAQQFVLMLSQMTGRRFRLPSEAEWEYAARGGVNGTGRTYAGCERASLDDHAWYCVNSGGRTYPVGRRQPNELGIYDMSGNVAEWCADWMGAYSADTVASPTGPRTGESRIVRGGHYYSTSSNCAVFDRGWYVPPGKTEYYGLRVVMDLSDSDNLDN